MIKIILVPLDGGERSAQVLDTALVVARRFDSHIKVVHVRQKGQEPYMFSNIPDSLREQYEKLNASASDSVADAVNVQFKAFCAANDVKVTRKPSSATGITSSLHMFDGNPRDVLGRESRLVDVIAMARPYRHRLGGTGVGELHESLMLGSGRPVLIVPPDWQARRVDRAAIGWNDSVEASRALALTLPWLVQMKKVSVVVSKKREASAEEVINYLACHGAKADKYLVANGGNVGKKLLAACDELDAEFLVVGGFTRTRTRQRLFGGVTSFLLANTDVITVMAH